MRRLLNLLASFMLALSLGTAATAHALERPNVSISANAPLSAQLATGHTPGDIDQVPADNDKNYPHHHGGCHGDHFAAPIRLAASVIVGVARAAPFYSYAMMLPRSTADPALRPPQA